MAADQKRSPYRFHRSFLRARPTGPKKGTRPVCTADVSLFDEPPRGRFLAHGCQHPCSTSRFSFKFTHDPQVNIPMVVRKNDFEQFRDWTRFLLLFLSRQVTVQYSMFEFLISYFLYVIHFFSKVK